MENKIKAVKKPANNIQYSQKGFQWFAKFITRIKLVSTDSDVLRNPFQAILPPLPASYEDNFSHIFDDSSFNLMQLTDNKNNYE